MRHPLSRRAALFGAGALTLAGLRGAEGGAAPTAPADHEPALGSLRALCRRLGIRHGAARDHFIEPDDPALDRLIAAECDLVVPENGGKWAILQPAEGRFDWRRFDAAVALAGRIGAGAVWHCALWQHMGMPPYMRLPAAEKARLGSREAGYFHAEGTLSAANQHDRFTAFVDAVAARYGDRFYRIDVANEVFFWETAASHAAEQDEHGFRKGMWWRTAGGADGPAWLDPFFHAVKARFPSARLVLNEFGIEEAEGWQQRKRAYLLRWLEGAVARGVPLSGVGLQSHLRAGKPYDRAGMVAFLRAVDRLGLEVHVTELDVDERTLPASWRRAETDRALAATLAAYLGDLHRHARLVELTWWGLRSDLNYIARQAPDRRPHPSPFDAEGRPLPLYRAALAALEGRDWRG